MFDQIKNYLTIEGLKKIWTASLAEQKSARHNNWQLISWSVIGALAGCIILTIYFVYLNIFNMLDNAAFITVLNAEMTMDTINADAYNKVRKAIELKTSVAQIPEDFRNIFMFGATSTPPKPKTDAPKNQP